jgi:CBS domain-containing protein
MKTRGGVVGSTVAEVMSERVIAVHENAEFAEIVDALRRLPIASLPVIDADSHVIGVISEDDLLTRKSSRGHRSTGLLGRFRQRRSRPATMASELMTCPVVTVTRTTPARDAAQIMHQRRIHQLPVLHERTGRLVGIVTRSDLLAVYERPDEDIRRAVRYDVIQDALGLDPDRFDISVDHGTVTVAGEVAHRGTARELLEAVRQLEGVVDVAERLTFRR